MVCRGVASNKKSEIIRKVTKWKNKTKLYLYFLF
jgi:hypothetical protein